MWLNLNEQPLDRPKIEIEDSFFNVHSPLYDKIYFEELSFLKLTEKRIRQLTLPQSSIPHKKPENFPYVNPNLAFHFTNVA